METLLYATKCIFASGHEKQCFDFGYKEAGDVYKDLTHPKATGKIGMSGNRICIAPIIDLGKFDSINIVEIRIMINIIKMTSSRTIN